MEPEADEVERIRRHRRNGGAIVDIVAGREQFFRIEMRPDATLLRPLQYGPELRGARREEQDGLADQRSVEAAGRIVIGFASKFG